MHRGSKPFKDNDSIKAHITEVYKFKNFEKLIMQSLIHLCLSREL